MKCSYFWLLVRFDLLPLAKLSSPSLTAVPLNPCAVLVSVGDFSFVREDAKRGQGLNDSIFPLLLHIMKINIYWGCIQLGATFHREDGRRRMVKKRHPIRSLPNNKTAEKTSPLHCLSHSYTAQSMYYCSTSRAWSWLSLTQLPLETAAGLTLTSTADGSKVEWE
ncbi:uncharacterized protein ACIQIH_005563 isoform 1-T3 [Cyanocitta cristata]